MELRLRKPRLWLLSDLHVDNPNCDVDALVSDLSAAKREGAQILLGGDIFDLMQLRHDPRRSYGGIRKEHVANDYIDAVLRDAVALLRPYRRHIAGVIAGNHELAALRHAATDVVRRLCEEIGAEPLPFRGWIRIVAGGKRYAMYYAHGAGGHHAPVTRGVIDVSRQLVYANADILWNAHTHSAYVLPYVREGADGAKLGYAIRTPSYLRSSATGSDYAALKGHAPNPVGCAVVSFGSRLSVELRVRV
ncbi:MAG: hypothetical protein RML84_09210 [Anaerolineae bacterium]|nr:hypothetical protein [Anaerolineae bacterium]